MLTNYKERSLTFINEWLEKSTRFDDSGMQIKEYEDFIFEFEVDVTYMYKANYEVVQQAGIIKPAQKDVLKESADSFALEIQNTLAFEDENPENAKLLESLITQNPYGFFTQETRLKTNESKIFYTYKCPDCHNGKVTCGSCSGRGKVRCSSCGGAGSHQKSQIVTGFDGKPTTRHYKETCSWCWGSGKVKCSSCGGSGEVNCSTCKGTSFLTEICTVFVNFTPNYELVVLKEDTEEKIIYALEKALLYNLEKYGEIKLLKRELKENGIYEKYNAKVPFARITSVLKDEEVPWLVYGKEIEIFDAGGVLDLLLEQDLLNLETKSKKCLLNPFIALTSRKTLKTFLSSEINEELLKVDAKYRGKSLSQALENKSETTQNLKFEERVLRDKELLNRAFSDDYIDKTLRSMDKITSAICFFSNLKWFFFSFVLILCMKIIDVLDIYLSSKKPFIAHKEAGVSYLNLSHHNTQSFFDFGVYWDVLSFDIFLMFLFMIFAVLATTYRYIYFRLINKSLATWTRAYTINAFRVIAYPFFGVLCIALFFYIAPVSIDANKLVYGLIPLEDVKEFIVYLKTLLGK